MNEKERQGIYEDWTGVARKVNILEEIGDKYLIEFPDCMTSLRIQIVSKKDVEVK